MKYLIVIIFYLLSVNFVWAAEKIDINTAPLEKLVKIIHIGEIRALELISLRPFSSLDELTKIKGIGEARVKDIKEQGLAWIATENEETPSLGATSEKHTEDGSLYVPAEPSIEVIELSKNSNNSPILAAIFTSFLSGVIILVLRKKLHVRA